MANDYYTSSGAPSTSSSLSSSAIRSQFNLVVAAFDKLPALTGNGGKFTRINSGGTAIEALSVADTRSALFIEGSPDLLDNVGIAASVSGGDLTVSLKTKDGSTNPSSTSKCRIGFRSATATNGGFEIVEAAGAVSVVLPGGGSLGFSNGDTGTINVHAINNAGTIELALSVNPASGSESSLISTTAVGTGSDSSLTIYSTSARTDVAARIIGRVTIQYGTGAWSNSPTVVTPRLF